MTDLSRRAFAALDDADPLAGLRQQFGQADAVQALLRAAGFSQVQTRMDLAGIARCSGGSMPVGLSPTVK